LITVIGLPAADISPITKCSYPFGPITGLHAARESPDVTYRHKIPLLNVRIVPVSLSRSTDVGRHFGGLSSRPSRASLM
jgi:hypothetical protein